MMFLQQESADDSKLDAIRKQDLSRFQQDLMPKSYLFASITLLWGMLFYLILIVYGTTNHHFSHGNTASRTSDSLSPFGITFFAMFFAVPLCLISLGAAIRTMQNSINSLHGPAKQCSKVACLFFHISWILFVFIQVVLHQMR